MHNPRLWRNIGLTMVAIALAAMASAFVLPPKVFDSWVGGGLVVGGLMVVIFGGLWTNWRYKEARAQTALLRGDDVIARWQVDADTWRAFVALNETFSVNSFSPRKKVPAQGVGVIVGTTAIMVDGLVHTLCSSALVDGHVTSWGGDWIVEQAGIHEGPPRCIALYARMPSPRGQGAYTNLVFPISPTAQEDGLRAFEHFRQQAADYAAMVAATAKS